MIFKIPLALRASPFYKGRSRGRYATYSTFQEWALHKNASLTRDLLNQQNQAREDEIAISREQSASAAAKHVGDVRVSQPYKY